MRPNPPIRSIFVAILALFGGNWCAAQPMAETLEPASVPRGGESQLAVVGKGVDRPVGIWTSLPAGKFKMTSVVSSSAKRSELKVEVAADCPLGLYGLRLATEDGLSNCLLFCVDDLASRIYEPGTKLTLPTAFAGVFKTGDVDRYTLEVQAGERVAFDVIASRLGTDADPLLTIFDADGKRLVRRDNDPGLFFDSCFEHTFEQAGTYTVEVRDARFLGSPAWRYVLRLGKFPAVRVALPTAVIPGQTVGLKFPELPGLEMKTDVPQAQPLGGFFHAVRRPEDNASAWVPLLATNLPSVVEQEPNNTLDTATLLPGVPSFAEGNLEQPGDRDYFVCELKKGDKLFLKATTKQLQSAADIELCVVDPMGKEMQRSDDVALPGGALEEASLTFNAGNDGKYGFLVREITGANGLEFTYRVEVQPAIPRIQVTTDIAATALPLGSYQALPLSVTRTDFNGEIELALVGAPPGVSLKPTTIPAGENIMLCKLRATSDAPLGLHTLTIAVKAQAGETSLESQVVFQPLIDKQHINQDLQKTALRENQRWLPPSVPSQFALQITPAIPYQVEPEEALVTLPRYHQTALKIQTPRSGEFEGNITFSAAGGQLGEEAQGRRQVFGRFPVATGHDAFIQATFHSRSQAQELKERIDIVSQGQVGKRNVTLTRSIMLQVKPSFEIEVTPVQATLLPGEKVTIKLTANRLPSFTEVIEVKPTTNMLLQLPEMLTIPAAGSVEFEIVVPADFKPRRDKVRFLATGLVNGFLEEPRQKELDLEVKAPPVDPNVKK